VLLAVFLPVAFLGGVTRTLYKQFAITIAISMVISGIMALTLSPALAAIIIKAHHGEKNRFFRAFEAGFEWVRQRYLDGAGKVIDFWQSRSSRSAASSPASSSCSARCRRASCPTRPGLLLRRGAVQDSASLGVTNRFTAELEKILLKDPACRTSAR